MPRSRNPSYLKLWGGELPHPSMLDDVLVSLTTGRLLLGLFGNLLADFAFLLTTGTIPLRSGIYVAEALLGVNSPVADSTLATGLPDILLLTTFIGV